MTYVNFNLNLMTKNTLISLNEVKLIQINNFQTNVGAFWTPKPTQLTVWVRFCKFDFGVYETKVFWFLKPKLD